MRAVPKLRALVLAMCVVAGSFLSATCRAQPCRQAACEQSFPADAGVLNVRDFGAKGDGLTDDTDALLRAIAASGSDAGLAVWRHKIVFLPGGTYLVSRPILKRTAAGKFDCGMILIGESVDQTTIRLADKAAGYDKPSSPRAVVMTTSTVVDKSGGRDYAGAGEGNDAYQNFVENLTVDVGRGNAGAIGIDYLANNIGAVRDVVVRTGDTGAAGISMTRKWPGPGLIQRVSVEGFDVGIDVAQSEYGMTLSHVRLSGQRLFGIRNDGNALSTEGLTFEDQGGVAIANRNARGFIVLADSEIAAGKDMARGKAAGIDNGGVIVFRHVTLPHGVSSSLGAPDGPPLEGWLEGADHWHAEAPAWTLKRPQAPVVAAGPADRWRRVALPETDAAARPDSIAAFRAAFSSGAETVYLPHGEYWVSGPIDIPAGVRRVIGMNSVIRVLPRRQAGFTPVNGVLRIRTAGKPITISRIAFDHSGRGDQVAIEVAGARTVVLQDVVGDGVTTLDRTATGGDVFVEDTCCGQMRIAGPHPVVARQLNTEGLGIRVRNVGAPLAVVGLKTEGYCTPVQSEAGARTEILGGLLYVVRRRVEGEAIPAFVTLDAMLSASFVEESLVPDSHYRIYLVDQQQGHRREVEATSMPARGLGRLIPLLSAGKTP